MILGIGVDLVHIPRIASLMKRRDPARFAARILSRNELASIEAFSSDEDASVRFLAVRWAVKEAAYKAFYPTIRPTWKELTYWTLGMRGCGSKPSLEYHPAVSQGHSQSKQLHVSVSHDGNYVVSQVVLEETQTPAL